MSREEPRTERFVLRLTPEERIMLFKLADARGTSASDLLRQLIRRAHAETLGPPGGVAPHR